MRSLDHMIRRFRTEERGSVIAEAVIAMPMLLWAYMALFVYWDGFRSVNTVQKATYTISDMLSREMVAISPAYVAGMDNVMEYMVDQDQNVSLRVSSVTWRASRNRFEIHWSRSTNAAILPALTTATLQAFGDCTTTARCRIPQMSDGDFVVIVESRVNYAPVFDVGIDNDSIDQFIVTRPRFVTCVLMTGVGTSCPIS